jgi:hypothetical protein
MKKAVLILLWVVSINTYAHQSNMASFTFNHLSDGTYTIELSGSLSGFETEVNYNYPESVFKTVEEFKTLVIKHFENSVGLKINNTVIQFKHPTVILGHETKIVAELLNVDNVIESIQLENTFFKDILRNKVLANFSGKDLPSKKYVLNNENNHTLNIILKAGMNDEK